MPHIYQGPELQTALDRLPDWKTDNGQLMREWTFPSFTSAIEFVNGVAQLAESAQHHPDIDIRYNKVQLALSTQDIGGITGADVQFAERLNQDFGR